MTTFFKLYDLLSLSERKKALALIGMILIMAALDVIGVASIMPFIAILGNPKLIESNIILNQIYIRFGFNDRHEFLFGIGLGVFILIVVSLAFKALTSYVQTSFTHMREFTIGKRLVEGYLDQPYSWFLNRNSAILGTAILSEVGTVIGGGLIPFMTVIAQGAVTLSLVLLLLLVDPVLALTTCIVLGSAYLIIFALMSNSLKRLGLASTKANQERFTTISEAFSATKEVKLGGLEQNYIKRFSRAAEAYASCQAAALVIAQLPRFVLEIIAFGGMLILILYIMAIHKEFTEAIPIIALYAFAGYRLMPALQQIYGALTQLRFIAPALNRLHKDLIDIQKKVKQKENSTPFEIKSCINLNKIIYRYPNSNKDEIKEININISVNKITGIVGSTGSGKTTTVDIILGLLTPQKGTVTIDGTVINEKNLRQWQNIIGYVPQNIYLADDTVGANIAFGVEKRNINYEKIEKVSRIANLHDFVVNNLPNGYSTNIGERGVRLSGGQKQRIGIARALYNNPKLLILDEATSALDSITEKVVMEAVSKLGQEITIIMIAHRLSTVRNCDQIYMLKNGQIEASGTFLELLRGNMEFAAMVENS